MPEYPESLTECFRTMSRFLVGEENLDDALKRLAHLAVDAIEPADFAGMTVPDESGARTAVFTDSEATELDQAQYDTGIGPCLDALRNNSVFRIDSTDDDLHWKPFSQTAVDHGILSVLSVPMAVNDRAIGALNLYARGRSAFSVAHERHAAAFAEQAAIVLANAQDFASDSEVSPQMRQALAARAVIDRARALLMRTRSCTPDEAFQLLLAASRRSNASLQDAAHHIVQRARRRPM